MHDLQSTIKEHQCHKFNKSMDFFCLLSLPGVLVLAIFYHEFQTLTLNIGIWKNQSSAMFTLLSVAHCLFFCSLYIWHYFAGHYLRLNIKWIKLRSDYSLLDLAQTHHNNNLSSQDCPDPSVKVAKLFLWDPKSDHWLPGSLTHSLTALCVYPHWKAALRNFG